MIECLGNREAAGTQSRGTQIVLPSLLLPFLAYYEALAVDLYPTIHQFRSRPEGSGGVVLCAR
jgi:hypothetical protein